jgi:hypothetical protein
MLICVVTNPVIFRDRQAHRSQEVVMKSRHKKVLSALIISVAIAAVGCASQPSQRPVPPMPSFTTENQKVCARGCQAVHSCCARSCIDKRGTFGSASDQVKCTDSCSMSLEQCYQTCK